MSDAMFWTVSLLLTDKEYLDTKVRGLDAKAFPEGPVRTLVRVLQEQYQEYGHRLITQPGLRAAIGSLPEDEQAEILDVHRDILTAYPVDDESRSRVRAVADMWLDRLHLGHALDEASAALAGGDMEEAMAALSALQQKRFEAEEQIDISNPDHFEKLRPKGHAGVVPTGIGPFDYLWEGGVHPGILAVALAPTNVGKSMFLAFLAAMAIANDLRVLFFTYELPPEEMTRRILGALLAKPIRHITHNERETMEQVLEIWPNSGLVVVRGDETPAGLGMRLDQLEELGRKPDVVIIDSADDMVPNPSKVRSEQEWQALGQIYRALLIDIAQGHNVAVWTSTQTDKTVVDKAKISLRNMGNAYEKAKRAHIVVGMTQTPAQTADSVVSMYVLKDTMHGSRGKRFDVTTTFGDGYMGWPGYEVVLGSGNLEVF